MASLLNALQLALGAGGAGISGYQRAQAQREEQERLRREEERRMAAEQKAAERQTKMDERQAMLDAAALRGEQRQAIASGMVEADRYNPRGIAGGMDMPGATPRQPVFRQDIGGKAFVLPESPTVTKHREALLDKAMKQATDMPYQWSDKYGVFLDRRTGKFILPENLPQPSVPARMQRTGGAGGPKPPSATDLTKETEGMSFLEEYASDQDVIKRVGAAIADNPALAERPGLIGYGILQDYKKRGLYSKGGARQATGGGRAPTSAPPVPGAPAAPARRDTMPSTPSASAAEDPLRKYFQGGR